MTAAATAEVARRHKQGLAPGATIVLRDAAAIGLANAGRQYLCVSLGNVVAVVPPRGHAGRADLRECMGRFGSPSSPRNKVMGWAGGRGCGCKCFFRMLFCECFCFQCSHGFALVAYMSLVISPILHLYCS